MQRFQHAHECNIRHWGYLSAVQQFSMLTHPVISTTGGKQFFLEIAGRTLIRCRSRWFLKYPAGRLVTPSLYEFLNFRFSLPATVALVALDRCHTSMPQASAFQMDQFAEAELILKHHGWDISLSNYSTGPVNNLTGYHVNYLPLSLLESTIWLVFSWTRLSCCQKSGFSLSSMMIRWPTSSCRSDNNGPICTSIPWGATVYIAWARTHRKNSFSPGAANCRGGVCWLFRLVEGRRG